LLCLWAAQPQPNPFAEPIRQEVASMTTSPADHNLSSDLAEYIVADIRHHGLTAHLRDLGEGARQ